MKIETMFSSETSVDFRRTWRYNTEEIITFTVLAAENLNPMSDYTFDNVVFTTEII
jgi:hypothetical protein